jgi:hypothetical protein
MSAFDLLMKKKKTVKRKHSPFIDCPAGCGARLFEKELNRHLDWCLNKPAAAADEEDTAHRTEQQRPKATTGQSKSEPGKKLRKNPMYKSERVICPSCQMSVPKALINLHLDHCSTSSLRSSPPTKRKIDEDMPLVSLSQSDVSGTIDGPRSPENGSSIPSGGTVAEQCRPVRVSQSPQKTPAPAMDSSSNECTIGTEKRHDNSVFAKMMANSKKAFATLAGRTETEMTQSFHLGADNQVQLRLRTLPVNEVLLLSRWSAMATIKDKADQGGEAESVPLSFEVHLSSAIWSDLAPRRWVRYHSRISVPVLKSLLQKSIRRRRPLDSVRIAMELADKALGELLRRLPIIVLEDSTMHDGLDFLVWVMMAQSKGFSPPVSVMTRIFQIVFEVASCPRQDLLATEDDDAAMEASPLTLTKLYNNCDTAEAERGQALLWAILVRAEYGGMKGDVRMLRRFATLWSTRLSPSALVPDEVLCAMSTSNKPGQWADVPTALHAPSKESSAKHVCELARVPIDRLRIENLCPEGIDFHCSSVLECLVTDKAVAGLCHDLLLLSGSDLMASGSTLETIAQRCMWKYSAGLNRRLPLVRSLKRDDINGDDDDDVDRYKKLWTDLLEPRTLAYQKQYINQRLIG